MIRRILKSVSIAAAAALAAITVGSSSARAQYSPSDLWPDFWELQQPGQFSVLGFAGGFVSDKYGTVQEGFQLEQSVTRYVGVFGRLTGFQLWEGEGFDNPLNPGTGHQARLNFGRAQGGIDINPFTGTHLFLSGGKDFGDSHAEVIEGDLSTWFLLHSRNPVNLSFDTIYNYQNHITSSAIDIQAIVLSREKYMVTAGAGGAWYHGGFLTGGDDGQGGPDLGFYYRPWQVGFSAQAGYGSAHQYGQITMYKSLNFAE